MPWTKGFCVRLWFLRKKASLHGVSYQAPWLFCLPNANFAVGLQTLEKIEMYNFFKAIFGIPPNSQEGIRINEDDPNDLRNFYGGGGGDDDDDDDDDDNNIHHNKGSPFGGGHVRTFGFPIFSDPIEIHKYFESLINEMHKQFETFGHHNFGNTMLDDGQSSFFNEESVRNPSSLRDSFLKNPGYVDSGKKEDVNLDGQVNAGDVENYLKRDPETPGQGQVLPKIFAKSVIIRTIRRPDGSVETIKQVRDHTGREETTITQDNVNDPNLQPSDGQLFPVDDIPGMSIFKKFFPF